MTTLIDLTVEVTEQLRDDVLQSEKMAAFGHLGTHFDVMDKEFPLAYTRREAVLFNVRGVTGRDIGSSDVDLAQVRPGMFVAFCSGHLETFGYGSPVYFKPHPQLAKELIEALLEKEVSIIGIDFPGMRRGEEHTPMDQRCADRGVFVVENLANLGQLIEDAPHSRFVACTYPIRFAGMTGLPCRVVAELTG